MTTNHLKTGADPTWEAVCVTNVPQIMRKGQFWHKYSNNESTTVRNLSRIMKHTKRGLFASLHKFHYIQADFINEWIPVNMKLIKILASTLHIQSNEANTIKLSKLSI